MPGADERDRLVSEAMMGAWIAFARGGDPNGPGLDQPEVMMAARSGYFEMHQSVEWQKAYEEKMRTADRVLKTAPVPSEESMAK